MTATTTDPVDAELPAAAPAVPVGSLPDAIPPASQLDWTRGVSMWGPVNPLARKTREWGLGDVWLGFGVGIGLNLLIGFIGLTLAVGAIAGNDTTLDPNSITNDLTSTLTNNGPFLIASLLGLWVGFVGAPLYASYRKGRKSLAADFGFYTRLKVDIPLGILFALGLRAAESVLLMGAQAVGVDMSTADNSGFLAPTPERAAIWTALLAVSAGVVAPIVEELFFRGLVFRAFLKQDRIAALRIGNKSLAPLVAIVLSSVLFGILHTTAATSGGAFVVLVTGLLGAFLAFLAWKTNRLGLAITTHIAFNTSAVILVLVS